MMPITLTHCCAARAAALLPCKAGRRSRLDRSPLFAGVVQQKSRTRMSDSQNTAATDAFIPAKPTLLDFPVSNNGARVRYIIYKLGLESEVDISSPAVLGGIRTEKFLNMNPQAKIPLLVDTDGTCVPESEVIVLYILEKFPERGGHLIPSTPALRAKARTISRLVDVYITPIQGAMYKQMEAGLRHAQLQQIARQLDILEQTIEGPFVLGEELCHADASIFPTLDFMEFMLPSIFGWRDVYLNRPKLKAYREAMLKDPAGAKVSEELKKALGGWAEKRRWDELGITKQVKNQDFNWACS